MSIYLYIYLPIYSLLSLILFTYLFVCIPRVEAGYKTSIVALRVVEGDEKGILYLVSITGPPCHWRT
jgi:hypothetical protein